MKKIVVLLFFVTSALNAMDEDEVKELLSSDNGSGEINERVVYLTKINIDIPDSENWLVKWDSDYTDNIILYSIADNKITNKIMGIIDFDLSRFTEFDIMKDIPGRRIENGTSTIADFNGDGFDEIFTYGFFGIGYYVQIVGYDGENNALCYFCDIPFDIVDKISGPAPVEFLEYKGMKGFKVYYDLYYGKPEHPPVNEVKRNRAWYFFAWDEKSNKFAEICEYIEGSEKDETEHTVETSNAIKVEALDKAEDEIIVADKPQTLKASYLFIGAGVLLVLVTIFILIRRKKR